MPLEMGLALYEHRPFTSAVNEQKQLFCVKRKRKRIIQLKQVVVSCLETFFRLVYSIEKINLSLS